MSVTYTKLFNSILDSSVWFEDETTRLVWITVLALKDRDQIVRASLKGLAHRARVDEEKCRLAIEKFENPDPDSKDPRNDGRRLERVSDGWLVLNGEKYDKKLSKEERREYNRVKQREHREKLKQGKPLSGEVSHQKLQESGATQKDLERHQESFLPRHGPLEPATAVEPPE